MLKKAMPFFTFVFFLLLASTLPAVVTEKNGPNALPKGAEKFLPKNYVALAHASEDFDGDGAMDVAVVAKRADSEWLDKDETQASPRPLLILLGDKKGSSYRPYLRNDDLVFSLSNGSAHQDPLWDIKMKKDHLEIFFELGGGPSRYSVRLSFRFSPPKKDWFLAKIEETSSDMNAPEGKDGEILEKVETRTPKQFGEVALSSYHRAAFFDWIEKK